MLERTDAITNEVLEPITFVLAYPYIYIYIYTHTYVYIYIYTHIYIYPRIMNILGYDQPFVSLIVLICNSELDTSRVTTCDVTTSSQISFCPSEYVCLELVKII
jgi:hypothetical protein